MILGRKIGMTQVWDEDDNVVPVTVIQAGPCAVSQVKTQATDGYDAVQIGFGDIKAKNVNKPMAGHFAKAGVEPVRFLREVRVENGEEGPEHRWGIAKCPGEQRRLFSSTPLSLFSSFQGKTAAQEQGPVWRFFFLNLGLMKQTE